MNTGFGMVFGGTANVHPFLIWAKPMLGRRWQNCCGKMRPESNQPKRPVGRPKNGREHYMFKLKPAVSDMLWQLKDNRRNVPK
jgi:hypothetical protein